MEKTKKYVAMVMDRHYVGPESFIFTCNHAVVGEIDENTHIFKDTKGHEYSPILNSELLKSEIPYAYNNVYELSALKKVLNERPIKDCLKEYEYSCKKIIYYVSNTTEGIPFSVGINVDSFHQNAEHAIIIDKMKRDGELPEDYDEQSELEKEETDEDQFTRLIIDVINKKYSVKELQEIKKELEENQNGIESALETVDLQIEAMQAHEEFTVYADKKKRKEMKDNTEEKEEQEEIKEEEKEEVKEEIDEEIDIEDLYNKVTKTLIAQDEPAYRVITELARKGMHDVKKKEAILLTGPTGVGKTKLMDLIAKYINKPFMKVNSTKITIPGYVGKDIEEVLWDLFIQCDRDLEKTESAIIYFDEIDKKGSEKKSDVSGQGVLNVLLQFIEGSEYDACADMKNSNNKVKIDTSKMTVILGGAFTDVYKKLLEKNSIGFGGNLYDKPTYREATTKDFVELAGMTDEFMGRVTVIKLNDLDVEDIKKVLIDSDESQIKIQEEIFEKLGVKITFTDGYLTKIAKEGLDKKTGARGLNGIIDASTWKAFAEVYKKSNRGKYKEVIITEETAEDSSNYQLVKKRGRKKKNN